MSHLNRFTLQNFHLNKNFRRFFYLIIFILILLSLIYKISLTNFNRIEYFLSNDKDTRDRNLTGEEVIRKTGFNLLRSQALPYNRSLPDIRQEECKFRNWNSNRSDLPKVSIIIVHYNEDVRIMLRALYSLYTRTPDDLLHEIILVNDFSDGTRQGESFEDYLRDHFSNSIRIENLQERQGLIRARMHGAKLAKAEVLVFLDAHIEVNVDWLPPLLEPMKEKHSKICTTPVIDTIRYDTMEYTASAPSRGGFNWDFNFISLPLLEEELNNLPKPHNNPIMSGGLFAIRRDYFWHLKGYDAGLQIWGGEQFELSFKIWMCGGQILEVPCSRIGHLYRASSFHIKYSNRRDDFISRNYKRVAEVWMDEYKEFLYEHIPKLTQIEAGDLRDLKRNRKLLKCKPFKWFLYNIAPDILKVYPPVEPNDYAQGAIQSLALPDLCLDTRLHKARQQLKHALQPCAPDLEYPYASQKWSLSFRKDIRQEGLCLEVQASGNSNESAALWLWNCHNLAGNQYWYYDRSTKLLRHGKGDRCLEVLVLSLQLVTNPCDPSKSTMKWHFGYINNTAMDKFLLSS